MWKLLKYGLFGYVLYQVIVMLMTQVSIREFESNADNAPFKRLIAVSDFAASTEIAYGKIPDWCPNISSSRGKTTLSVVNDIMVCCDTDEWLVPYKDVGENRLYLCGKWPRIEIITQPLNKTKLGVAHAE